jgi:hypothetical protein
MWRGAYLRVGVEGLAGLLAVLLLAECGAGSTLRCGAMAAATVGRSEGCCCFACSFACVLVLMLVKGW